MEMREANEVEVEAEVEDEDSSDVTIMDGVQDSSTIVTRKEKVQQEDVEEDIQAQGMINLKLDAITVRSLATTLQNVDFSRIESRRKPIMWRRRMRSLKQCC